MRSDADSPPPEGFVPLCVPHIQGNEGRYLQECLDTNWVSSAGPFVSRFEGMVADYLGAGHAVATVNGTAALHVALLVGGVQPGEEVIVSTLTFIAPANAVRYVGAWPVFIDAEPEYWQMDTEKLARFLKTECHWTNEKLVNRLTGRRISAILPVHILGHPCDMDPILELARRYRLTVVEDATESLGARYKGRMVGRLGDIACFSFNGNKLLTTGAGGMVVTDDPGMGERAKYLANQAKDDSVEYVHQLVGFNYRLSNLHAAMGCAQMEHIDAYIAAKHRIAAIYVDALKDMPGLSPMGEAPWAESVFWLFTVLVDQEMYGMGSRELLGELEERGIQTRPLWQPIHMSPAHNGSEAIQSGVAERLYRDALSLPCSVGLEPESQQRVLSALASLAPAGQPSA